MASRKRARGPVARSCVVDSPAEFLPTITDLIERGGQICIGAIGPIKCVAVANDDDQCYAMLQRRPAETLRQLLERLDDAIDAAITTEETIDEINTPVSKAQKVSRGR